MCVTYRNLRFNFISYHTAWKHTVAKRKMVRISTEPTTSDEANEGWPESEVLFDGILAQGKERQKRYVDAAFPVPDSYLFSVAQVLDLSKPSAKDNREIAHGGQRRRGECAVHPASSATGGSAGSERISNKTTRS